MDDFEAWQGVHAVNMGLPATLTVYDLLKDQGGVIGGLLGFAAGLLIFLAGRAQVKAVERQNEEFKRAERRGLARGSRSAARLIDGILSGIEEDINRELIYVKNQTSDTIESTFSYAMCGRIKVPDKTLTWNRLGDLDQEILKTYMNLERYILKL